MPPEIAAADREGQDEWLFRRASVWPDVVRDRGEPERRSAFNRDTWHYINIPLYLTPADEAAIRERVADGLPAPNVRFDPPEGVTAADGAEGKGADGEPGMNAVQALRFNLAAVADENRSAAERAVALCWVLHLGGDVHQPMHAAALFTDGLYPEGDRGGNLVKVAASPGQPGRNLHALWDAAPGATFTPVEVSLNAERLLADEGLSAAGAAAAGDLDPRSWARESRTLAQWAVYTPDVLAYVRTREAAVDADRDPDPAPLRVAEEDVDKIRRLADRRLTEAGFRLGAALAK
ncbi:S1/P1 nuclease [Alienimonas chondri]|uniref:S1/P1 Nuclease n=1 Tax=Alienimonas chondri TaxID=2681879 RepID=A0ABX1VHT1_9PLAN|nr:S1/P1 nuclease [Alienimonas chondri]NNJ27408.1 hypothetical protein [Alienimonas chondri]